MVELKSRLDHIRARIIRIENLLKDTNRPREAAAQLSETVYQLNNSAAIIEELIETRKAYPNRVCPKCGAVEEGEDAKFDG